MSKRLKTEEDKFVNPDQSKSEASLVHKNQLDEVISKFAVGFSVEEKQIIQSILSQYPDAKDGFLQLLQLFSAKLNVPAVPPIVTAPTTPVVDTGSLLFEIKEVSFLKPRKKLDVKIYANNIQLVQSGKVETTITNNECIRLLCVASKKNFNMLLFYTPAPVGSSTPKKKKDSNAEEVVVFTLSDNAKLDITSSSKDTDLSACKDAKSKFCKMLEAAVIPLNSSFKVIDPKQHAYSFRSSKKEMYVDCHLKAKDGQLYFFDEGLFFGMKQPFTFIPKETIARIAVNSMRRTFDLHVLLENDTIVEFSMIDGSEQNNVANWVEWNGINKKKDAKPIATQQKKIDDDTPVVVATVTKNPTQPLRRSTRTRKEADTVSAPPPMMDDDDEEDDNYDQSESEDEDSDSDKDVGPENFMEADEEGPKAEQSFKVTNNSTNTSTTTTIDISSSSDEKEVEPKLQEPQPEEEEEFGFFAVKH